MNAATANAIAEANAHGVAIYGVMYTLFVGHM